MACSTSASASARRPPPSARAMAEEMPPPMAPAESICIIMNTGKTSAMPASASVPRRETHQVSMRPVEACASMTRMFGQARRSRVGMIDPCSSRRVRGSSAAGCATAGAVLARATLRAGLPALLTARLSDVRISRRPSASARDDDISRQALQATGTEGRSS